MNLANLCQPLAFELNKTSWPVCTGCKNVCMDSYYKVDGEDFCSEECLLKKLGGEKEYV